LQNLSLLTHLRLLVCVQYQMVKLKPILQSLHLAQYLGFTLVNFEIDTRANELGPILRQCHEILASHDDYQFVFIRRQDNRVGDNLARESILESTSCLLPCISIFK
jgi:hypothetical protein